MELLQPDLGQRMAVQAGAMTPITYFEHGKMKRVDFGPVYNGVWSKDGRIFLTEHEFFSTPILQDPISPHTNIDDLKERLGLLRRPILREFGKS